MSEPSMLLRHVIRCHYSGLPIGTLEVRTTAGALPYLSRWNETIAYHPVFSLKTERLLSFVRSEWDRLARLLPDEEISDAESQILCAGYLALLHRLDCIKQDIPALPPLAVVQSTIGKLFALSYWKWKLESERFRFPTLHISKQNGNSDFKGIADYLEVCFEIRKEYETKVSERTERAKAAAAEKALQALNNTWLIPPSKKVLWQWVKSNLPAKYQPDAQGWLSTLFLGGNHAIWDFEKEDIELAREIIVSECPPGTGIMHAVRERLDKIQEIWATKHQAFEIELEDFAPTAKLFVNGVQVKATDPGPEPVERDFAKKSQFYVAHAKWTIARKAFQKQGESE